MAEQFLARKQSGGNWVYEWLSLSSDPRIVMEGSLEALALAVHGKSVIFLLPAVDVLQLEVKLPVKTSRQINQALPYAIEDFLAGEVENYRLAWHKQADGSIAVSAIDWERLRRYEADCQQAGIALSGLYSELLFVPYSEGSASLMIDEEVATLRLSAFEGGCVDYSGLPILLEKLLAEQKLPSVVKVWSNQNLSMDWPEPLQTEQNKMSSVLELYAEHLPKNPPLNLLSGNYGIKASGTRAWLPWLPAVAMVVLAVALQWGKALQTYWHSQTQLHALEESNQAVFRQTFPELKRIVNIKAQAGQALDNLRKNASVNQNQGYLFLLYKTGESLADSLADPAVGLSAMEFNRNTLSLSLKTTSISQLDVFKQKLESSGLKANIRSAESGSNGVQAQLDISN